MENAEEVEKSKKEIINIISNIIDKGANYVIKAMPVNEHIKEILMDVKNVVKEGEFEDILSVAINSSIREGIEIAGAKKNEFYEMKKIVDFAFDGGLTNSINLGIDMVGNIKKYGNIFYNYIDDFFEGLKIFISSNEFKKKVYNALERCLNLVDSFKELCNDWYDAYDKFDVNQLKDIAGQLNKMKKKVAFNDNCLNENSIIQNATGFIKSGNKKLSSEQLDMINQIEIY